MEIIGHHRIIQFLQKSIINNKLAHAYLFYGPAHIGKSKVAEYLAASLVCQNQGPRAGPCGECINCQQVLKHLHPDIYWISEPVRPAKFYEAKPASKDKRQIRINQIRQLKERLTLTPFSATYKIAIIEEAENLTIQAANSLLKLLEEPPQKAIIILVSKSLSGIPATIRSRTQILRFSLPPFSETISFLKKNFGLSCEKAWNLLSLALGQPGLAIEFVENPEKLILYQEKMAELVKILSEPQEVHYRFEKVLTIPLEVWLGVIRDLILVKLGLRPSNPALKGSLKDLAGAYSKKKLADIASQILETQFYLSHNVNEKLAMENLLLTCNI